MTHMQTTRYCWWRSIYYKSIISRNIRIIIITRKFITFPKTNYILFLYISFIFFR